MSIDDIIRMARECGNWSGQTVEMNDVGLERFAALVAAAERNSAAEIAGDFARKWWSLYCANKKHMETTLMAHNDFCALQSAIKARGNI